MKTALLSLGILASSIFSSGQANVTSEENFWKWCAEMHKINPSLTFEFGPKEKGQREFVISADGIKDAFPEVERLYAAAPSLPRWKFVKFRPRRKPSDITYQGVTVKAASVVVEGRADRQVADLTVFIPGYTQAAHKTYAAITFLLLDEALGEYDVETRIGQINVESSSKAPTRTCSLEALPPIVDALLAHKE